ncbi:MAG TPA: hypothetical protein VF459_17125 [Caulobacteraceae bacterium]
MEQGDIVIGRMIFVPNLLYLILLTLVLGGGDWLIYDAHGRSLGVLFQSSGRMPVLFIVLLAGFCLIALFGIPSLIARALLIDSAVIVVRNGSVIVPMAPGWPEVPLAGVTCAEVTGPRYVPSLVLRARDAAIWKMSVWAIEPEAARMAQTLNALIAAAKTGGS